MKRKILFAEIPGSDREMSFATCLNCIDGRTHLPLIDWIKTHHEVQFVDLITEPAMIELLACGFQDNTLLLSKIRISLEKHSSKVIIAAGHHDCAGCSKNNLEHKKDLDNAVANLAQLFPEVRVCGVWINENWTVERVI